MMKKKKIAVIAVSAVLACVIAGTGIYFAAGGNSKVQVCPVANLNNGAYWQEGEIGDSGYISTSGSQSIYYSEDMEITDVYVKEGDTVKKGDSLVAYDTTLMTLELEMKQLQVEGYGNNVENIKAEIAALRKKIASADIPDGVLVACDGDISALLSSASVAGGSSVLVASAGGSLGSGKLVASAAEESGGASESDGSGSSESGDSDSGSDAPETDPAQILSGNVYQIIEADSVPYNKDEADGSVEHPFRYYVVADETTKTVSIAKAFIKDALENEYVVILDHVDSLTEPTRITASTTMDFASIASVAKEMYETPETEPESEPETEPETEPWDDPGYDDSGDDGYIDYPVDPGEDTGYTKEEIQKQIKEKEKSLADTELALKEAQLELKKLQKNLGDGTVKATIDGTVTSVLSEEEARLEGAPMIRVTGDEGYYVTGYVAETSIDSLENGTEVYVTNWEDGMTYTADVTEVGDTPTSEYSGQNPNMSWYPFQAVITDETAVFDNGAWVSLSMDGSYYDEGSSALYLSQAFVREEGTRSYVYKKGDNGRLEKAYIETGKIVYGTVEIKGGLTEEDEIAFPYGVKAGAKTESVDMLDEVSSYY